GEQGEPVVRYRDWVGAAWSSERSAEDVGNNPQWTVAQRCPKREEFAVLTLDSTKQIAAQFRVDRTWTAPTIVSHNCVTSSDRPMDLAYEQQSGELLMVYRVNSDASR